MKTIIATFGLLLIAVNLLFGYLLTVYLWHTALVTSVALLIEVVFMMIVSTVSMKDAFRLSLNVLFPFLALIQFITLLYVPQDGFDSICYVIAVGIMLLQVLLILAVNKVSKLN